MIGDGALMGGLTGLDGDDFLLLRAGECTGSPRGDVSRTDGAVDAFERACEALDDRRADEETDGLEESE